MFEGFPMSCRTSASPIPRVELRLEGEFPGMGAVREARYPVINQVRIVDALIASRRELDASLDGGQVVYMVAQ
jgi:hypothetical protein